MRILKIVIIFTLLFTTFDIANGQPRMQPKKINTKEIYTHSVTNVSFPQVLFDGYKRMSVYSFDKKNKNIGVTYEKNMNGEKIIFSLYLYPAGDGCEGRLRQEYKNSMQTVTSTTINGLNFTQVATQHEGEKYICNGFKAMFTSDNGELSQLTLFESGTWFYKIRITTSRQDSALLLDMEKEILQKFDPTSLTDLTPLNDKVNIYFNKTAFRDSTLLGSAMGSAFKKIEWVMDNVKEKERATGFPDLYLELHVEALKAFMEFQHRVSTSITGYTKRYLEELQAIFDAGFLPEFVMDQYEMVLIIPDDIPDRRNEYLLWKSENNISINLNEKFYILSFDAAK